MWSWAQPAISNSSTTCPSRSRQRTTVRCLIMLLDIPTRRKLSPLLFLAVVAMIITIWQHAAGARGRVSLPEYVCQALGYPVMSAVTKVNEVLRDRTVSVFYARSLAAENRRLRQERDRLLAERVQFTEYFRENKAIYDELGFEHDMSVEDIPARVIARSGDNQRCRVTIRVPRGREIHKNDIVRQAAGLVGRVIAVHSQAREAREIGSRTADVLVIMDAQHGLGARNQRSGETGVVKPAQQWTAGWPDRLQMDYLRRGADIRTGDVIVTSGEDGIYPPSLPIGIVEAVTASPTYAQTVIATIRPFVDFEHLQYVWVVPMP